MMLGAAFTVEWAWLGAFVGLAAFAWSVDRHDSIAAGSFVGGCFGWSGYVAGFFWLQPALASFWEGNVALSWLVWLAWGVWVSFRFVATATLFQVLRSRSVGVVTSLTLAWITVEWLYPSLFPFFVANPLIDQAWLVQTAALGGPLLVSAWVCAVSALLATSASAMMREAGASRAESFSVFAATIGVLAYGAYSNVAIEQRLRDANTLTVGVIQANVNVVEKRAERALSHRRHVRESRSLLSEADVDLLIWPETSVLYALPTTLPISGAAVLAGIETPLLFGGVRRSADGRRFNSAMLIGADGIIRTAYDKRLLIPFAEFVPLGDRLPWWEATAPTLSRFTAGRAPVALELDALSIATPICYETIRPRYVRELVRDSAPQLLVSLTNDGWFGDSPEPRIHLRLARFRAIEHRLYMVRATNTGISAIIDPLGRVLRRAPLFEPASMIAEVGLLQGTTIYGIFGDWPGLASAVVLAGLLLAPRRRRPLGV